ncbi:ribonuclease t2 [Anaeramoeba flamelloides]|uniref:Ribonuclease t2 n=1 Tax=Anaeramoeba flamelloides TaxID=1746091 RepID=A0AAV8AEF7_9EUKA|nr:ribonuclease t2 [Anaeramoeba flamelloides]|eukprot:Anaeramoba_flamelloidesa331703_246.p1 GENE.a331703_246~~a331703_246.p1  ORF type:complete len:236 (-),score=31.32 a331703_246:148-819(-)
MKKSVFVLSLFLVFCFAQASNHDFDYILMNLNWPGSQTNTFSSSIDHFTLHGLWPNYNSGSWPQYCTSEKFDKSDVDQDLMETWWTDVWSPSKEWSFWGHEWERHGTCLAEYDPVTKTQKGFFELGITLVSNLDFVGWLQEAGIKPSKTTSYKPADMLAAIKSHTEQDVFLGCGKIDGVEQVETIVLCFSKGEHEVMKCPDSAYSSWGKKCNYDNVYLYPINH